MMRVTALVRHPDHICCRYRFSAFAPSLQRAGHQLDVRRLPKFWLTPWLLRRAVGPADAVVVQRKLLSSWQLSLLRRAAPFMIFDVDDAVFMRDSYADRGQDCPRRSRRFAAMVRAADAVVVGNVFLREKACAWTDPWRVHLVPTCVDLSRYSAAKHHRSGKQVQMVWIGSSSTLQGLDRCRPLLEHLGQEIPGLTLKIICDRLPALDRLEVVPCPWTEAQETADLADADIGISWLPDDDWSRGKCGLKVLQYMAAGLPVVANPVGVQTVMVRHGETGFLAQTHLEWAQAIHRLAHDPELRRRMGAAARQRVQKEFDLPVGARSWLAMLQNLGPARNKVQPAMAAAG